MIRQRLDAEEDIHYLLDNAICLCPNCHTIKTISRLNYSIAGDEAIQLYDGKCNRCGGDVAIIPEEEVSCPVCGQKTDLKVNGHWD